MLMRESILIELAGVRRLAALLGCTAEFAEVCLGLLRELRLTLSPAVLLLVAVMLLAGCKPAKFDRPAPERPPKTLAATAPVIPAAP